MHTCLLLGLHLLLLCVVHGLLVDRLANEKRAKVLFVLEGVRIVGLGIRLALWSEMRGERKRRIRRS